MAHRPSSLTSVCPTVWRAILYFRARGCFNFIIPPAAIRNLRRLITIINENACGLRERIQACARQAENKVFAGKPRGCWRCNETCRRFPFSQGTIRIARTREQTSLYKSLSAFSREASRPGREEVCPVNRYTWSFAIHRVLKLTFRNLRRATF